MVFRGDFNVTFDVKVQRQCSSETVANAVDPEAVQASPIVFMHFKLVNFARLNDFFCRNIASQTIARLKDVARRISSYLEAENINKERSASLDLLLRFQRLLVSKLYMRANGTETVNGYSESCIWG